MNSAEIFLPDEAATARVGAILAPRLRAGGVVYLQGDLGAGKTTLVRGLLRALGHADRVRSPSYTLMEPYVLPGLKAYHLDLYRIGEAAELDFLGLDDIDPGTDLLLVEWPERARERLPPADLALEFGIRAEGRQLRLIPIGLRGPGCLQALNHELAS